MGGSFQQKESSPHRIPPQSDGKLLKGAQSKEGTQRTPIYALKGVVDGAGEIAAHLMRAETRAKRGSFLEAAVCSQVPSVPVPSSPLPPASRPLIRPSCTRWPPPW